MHILVYSPFEPMLEKNFLQVKKQTPNHCKNQTQALESETRQSPSQFKFSSSAAAVATGCFS